MPSFKWIQVVGMTLLSAFWMPFASATDSSVRTDSNWFGPNSTALTIDNAMATYWRTSTSSTGTTTPSTPFVADFGFISYNSGGLTSGGGSFNTNVQCPYDHLNYVPVIFFSITQLTNQANNYQVCVDKTKSITQVGLTNYTVNYDVSKLYVNGALNPNNYNNIGISWTLYCYPFPSPTTPAMNYSNNSGQCVNPTEGTDYNAPGLLWDTGSLDFLIYSSGNPVQVSVPTTKAYPLQTNRQCPAGYNPYIVFTPNKFLHQQDYEFMCFDSIAPSGNGYVVNFAANWNSLNGGFYGITSMGFQWSVYCMPASMGAQSSNTANCNMYQDWHSNYDLPVIAIESGEISNESCPSALCTFYTNTICPVGYSAYVTLTGGGPNISPPSKFSTNFMGASLCVHQVSQSGTTYQVQNYNYARWDNSTLTNAANVNGYWTQFRYQLFCYPPYKSPPAYQC